MVCATSRRLRSALLSAAVLALSSCGGGGSGSTGPVPAPTPTPAPTATPPVVSTSTGTVSPSGPTAVVLPPAAGGVSGSITLTAASAATTVALTLSATPPSGAPALQSDGRLTRTIGASAIGLAYVTARSSADVSFNSTFGANIAVPGPVNGAEYLVMYDPGDPRAGWTLVSVPGTAAAGIAVGFGNVVMSFAKDATYVFALIATQSSLTLPLPSPTPSATPAATASPTPTATPSPPTQTFNPVPQPTATPVPTPTPTPAPVVVNVPSLRFLGAGSAFVTTISVTQANYNGMFVLSGTSCNGIASADTTSSAQNFTITPVAAGTCSYTLTGGGGAQTSLPVTVTTVTVGGA